MKKLFVLGLALSLNLGSAFANDATAAKLKVLGARFNAETDSVEVAVKYKGGCDDTQSLRLRGCADLMFPYTCQVDVVLKRGAVCEEDVQGVISMSREELGMKNQKFSAATLIIQDPTKKSSAKIKLPINK